MYQLFWLALCFYHLMQNGFWKPSYCLCFVSTFPLSWEERNKERKEVNKLCLKGFTQRASADCLQLLLDPSSGFHGNRPCRVWLLPASLHHNTKPHWCVSGMHWPVSRGKRWAIWAAASALSECIQFLCWLHIIPPPKTRGVRVKMRDVSVLKAAPLTLSLFTNHWNLF